MKKPKLHYVCTECGHRAFQWAGRCPSCEAWNTLQEEEGARPTSSSPGSVGAAPTVLLTDATAERDERLHTGVAELDRVLGGGAVPGMAVLIGGDPGIGKSTLLLQACARMAEGGLKALYGTAEESVSQLALRSNRLGLKASPVLVASVTELERLMSTIEETSPEVVVVDSIQMLHSDRSDSMPGSVSQLRLCSLELVRLAKTHRFVLFLIGHITKDGTLAGPKLLEHMVDTVLYFEGDVFHSLRLLRAVKNRYGPTDEVGVFEMLSSGLEEVPNPSQRLLEQRGAGTSGSVVTSMLEGSRSMFVEVQALVSRSNYGAPERRVTGVDFQRTCMILAVLEKRAGIRLGTHDVFVNVAGGVRAIEPGIDLSIALAIASSHLDRPFPEDAIAVGEIGLGGEVRRVGQIELRLREAAKLGFSSAIVPARGKTDAPIGGLKLIRVTYVADALRHLAEH